MGNVYTVWFCDCPNLRFLFSLPRKQKKVDLGSPVFEISCYNFPVKTNTSIIPLTKERFDEAVDLLLKAELDTREEIEHHLQHLDAHYVALDGRKIIGVIGWYQDNVHYADTAMGNKFPGEEAYWVGFFAVDKKYRGRGVGYTLLHRLESVLKEKNITELWVSSVPKTRSYYEKHGFSLVMEGEISGNKKFFLVKKLWLKPCLAGSENF